KKSAEKLVQELAQKKAQVSLARFVYALGIRHVGKGTAQLLVDNYPSLEQLAQASQTDLEAIRGVGPQIAESVVQFFQSVAYQALLAKFQQAGLQFAPVSAPSAAATGPFAGKQVVLTGTLQTLSRPVATQALEAQGARVKGTISRQTDYVIVG